MKISKSILSAMTAGILTIGMTSCDTDIIDVTEKHTDECTEECMIIHNEDQDNGYTPWNCPGCGMG